MPRIFYLSKPDNPPNYKKGKELHLIHDDIGWVEYLSQHLDIFWIEGVDEETFNRWKTVSLGHCAKHYHLQDFTSLGLLKNLVEYRTERDFDLPIFASYDRGSVVITCGLSRLFAMASCHVSAKDIKFFLQAKKGIIPNIGLEKQLITSTAQAEQLSGIGEVNHVLTMHPTYPHCVTSSVIRDSVYNKPADEQFIFADTGRNTMEFWNKFLSSGQINIEIHCAESSLPFVRFDSKIWHVNYHVGPMDAFLYADILHKFHQQLDSKLHLNLYNITQPFDLEYMLPLVSKNNSWYHTQNKKVHLYETTQTSNGAEQPIISWPNFVK